MTLLLIKAKTDEPKDFQINKKFIQVFHNDYNKLKYIELDYGRFMI